MIRYDESNNNNNIIINNNNNKKTNRPDLIKGVSGAGDFQRPNNNTR